jgi:predicted DNA-binding transcriptional regulator
MPSANGRHRGEAPEASAAAVGEGTEDGMKRAEFTKESPVLRHLYRPDKWDANKVAVYDVLYETPKQLKVREQNRWLDFVQTIRRDDIGRVYFESEHAAWVALAASLTKELEGTKRQLQRLRTSLGMVESSIKRTASTQSVDAVDPVGCVVTS